MRYQSSTVMDKETAGLITRRLDVEPSCEKEAWIDDYPIGVTVAFPNGFEMDIECCPCGTYEEDLTNTAWGQAVLFDSFGNEVKHEFIETSGEFFEPQVLSDGNGNEYVAHIIMSKED